MKTEAIIKKIESIPGGRYFRVRFMSKVKTKAAWEKEGYSLIKIVDMTTRTGVAYSKVKKTPSTTPVKVDNNWEWIAKNRIKHNKNTGKDYLVVAPIRSGSNKKTTYILTKPDGTTYTIGQTEAAKYAIDSYWRETTPEVMNITLENILLIK